MMDPDQDKQQHEAQTSAPKGVKKTFPWILWLLSGCVIFLFLLTFCIVPGLSWALREGLVAFLMLFCMEAYMLGIVCGALMVLLLPYYAVIFFAFRRRIRNEMIWKTLLLLPAILLIGRIIYSSTPAARTQSVLSSGQLAPLPKSARDIKVGHISFVIGSRRFLKFHASRKDIEHFLNASPGLHDQASEGSRGGKVNLAQPERGQTARAQQESGNRDDFACDQGAPAWYKQELMERDRFYQTRDQGVQVIVDDEQNVVFVRVSDGYM